MNENETDTETEDQTEDGDEGATPPGLQALSAVAMRQLSTLDWARFGAQQIAYIRPVLVNGAPAVAIHAADGTPIGAAPNALLAAAAIRQHAMEPQLVH